VTAEQLAAEFAPLAAADFIPLPPLPKPVPPKPAPAAAPAADGTPAPAPAPAPAVPVAPPPPPPKAVDVYNFAEKGFHFEATVPADKVVEAAQILDGHGFAIDAVTGMDWLGQGLMEVVYDFLHFSTGLRVVVKARVPRAKPEIATISGVFPGANWHERETHDMYGIEFIGHPDMTPFLMPEDSTDHPLRKDFNP
jgi:NADH-quinone oxidoreductase subunit C